ncbi:hypothetical protein MTE1_4685 [Klebsiella pneumoniae JHCK1]|nr:hypothetical protein MTE1_4685 [Klebsiella pneumoniae JHCK1]
MFIANARQHGRFQPLNRGAKGHVAGGAAQIFRETGNVF